MQYWRLQGILWRLQLQCASRILLPAKYFLPPQHQIPSLSHIWIGRHSYWELVDPGSAYLQRRQNGNTVQKDLSALPT